MTVDSCVVDLQADRRNGIAIFVAYRRSIRRVVNEECNRQIATGDKPGERAAELLGRDLAARTELRCIVVVARGVMGILVARP